MDILLSNISMEAKLSAPALLQLLGTLARDLQEEYMPYVARVFTHVTNLVHQGLPHGWQHASCRRKPSSIIRIADLMAVLHAFADAV